MACTVPRGKNGKLLYTTGPERRVYNVEASDPEKEKKEGFYGVGGYFFLRRGALETHSLSRILSETPISTMAVTSGRKDSLKMKCCGRIFL